ncbi:(d)CMP kinase [Buchnera aphidicola]|uniref:(d)CMP kinase n=1 Tax=Buchnera aphidicola TaxID=9 RepID=UPI0028FCA560|nr:(d)CMP kinase [Buchnera aphidicola]
MRDERDQNRSISPLYPSENAIILYSTKISFEKVVKTLTKHIVKKTNIYFKNKYRFLFVKIALFNMDY